MRCSCFPLRSRVTLPQGNRCLEPRGTVVRGQGRMQFGTWAGGGGVGVFYDWAKRDRDRVTRL